MNDSLWGEEFIIPNEKEKTKTIINKISKPKEIKTSVEKQLKSKALTLEEKLKIIKEKVFEVLGKQKDNIIVIKDKQTFHNYMDKCINSGRIAVDTETNNSLDPITCKLMGLCLYYPGGKQAYIPINHRDPNTGERLDWQLTEKDCKEELERCYLARQSWKPDFDEQSFTEWYFKNSSTSVNNPYGPLWIFHNGKFDYQVMKCTSDIVIPIDWDTLIGAKVLDENEYSAKLKHLYIKYIDPEQEKYSIDELFEGVEYADVDPDIFAFYAATDSMMTDKLAAWQINKFKTLNLKDVFTLFTKIEIPLVHVIGEMELAGMEVDQEYAELLSKKYHHKLDKIDRAIKAELDNLQPRIDAWKLSTEANSDSRIYVSKNTKMTQEKIIATYPFVDEKGERYKVGKSMATRLEEPINLASPTQLAILFYDILKCPAVSTKSPRGTGEDELIAIADKLKLPICNLLVERRGIVKLITTYIDIIPELAKRWPDGRVRTHFNQYGAATGRLSSSDPINF